MVICSICDKRLNLPLSESVLDTKGECEFCGGILEKVDQFFLLFKDEINRYKCSTFLIGLKASPDLVFAEKKFLESKGLHSKTFKEEFQYLLGTKIEKEMLLRADFSHPEAVFSINQSNLDSQLWIKSIYIQGRYLKLRRGMPQSPWIKPGKGKENERSVSEFIGESVLETFKGTDYNFFASGREDVEALMLGTGRPFYVEVKRPVARSFESEKLEQLVVNKSDGGVKVKDLKIAGKEEIDNLKRQRFDKSYEVGLTFEGNKVSLLESVIEKYSNIKIMQRTPNRVLSIRADKTRERAIRSVKVKEINWPKVTLIIKAEAGTYIKEFITGDGGRTTPNLSDELEVNVKIDYLNVFEIY